MNPNDLCGCGSGRLYIDCHQPIRTAAKGKMIAAGQAQYVKEWSLSADHYQEQGIYLRLAEELVLLGGIRRVLDIGCGLGHGLSALKAAIEGADRLLVGIDENSVCLADASVRLGLESAHPHLRRVKSQVQLSGLYETFVDDRPITVTSDVALINVDIMVPDPKFSAWLDKVGPFDAITLWFTGVHKARSATKLVQKHGIQSDADHRELIEHLVVQLARERLRSKGVLHVVNRFQSSDLNSELQNYSRKMNQRLNGVSLAPIKFSSHPYTDLSSMNAMQVKAPHSGAANLPRAAFSMLAQRE